MPKKKTQEFINKWKPKVEQRMQEQVEELEGVGVLKDAVSYALFNGGKKIRPLFYLAIIESFKETYQDYFKPLSKSYLGLRNYALDKACAWEYFHTFTLIQDDLPCMDNDESRRGKASLWKKFGESTALLASNVLLGMAFKVPTFGLLDTTPGFIEMLMPDSVIGGQALDLGLEEGASREKINQMKTADFFEKIATAAKVDIGRICPEGQDSFVCITEFAGRFGAYFQHRDDYFDSENIVEKNKSKKKMEKAMRDQEDMLRKMGLEDSVLGGFASWLIDKE